MGIRPGSSGGGRPPFVGVSAGSTTTGFNIFFGEWTYNSLTGAPASGEYRFDNADPALATRLRINKTADDGTVMTELLKDVELESWLYIEQSDDKAKRLYVQFDGTFFDNASDIEYGIKSNVIIAAGGNVDNGSLATIGGETGIVNPNDGIWQYDTDIAVPTTGEYGFDNANPALATVLRINVLDVLTGMSHIGLLDNAMINSWISISSIDNPRNALYIKVGSVTNNTTYIEYGIVDRHILNNLADTDLAVIKLITSQAKAPRVVPLVDAATIALDASLGNLFTVTIDGNRTLGNPTNPTSGQPIIVRVQQDAVTGSRTLAYDTEYNFSTDLPSPTLSTGTDEYDYLGFIRNNANTTWDFVGKVFGFS